MRKARPSKCRAHRPLAAPLLCAVLFGCGGAAEGSLDAEPGRSASAGLAVLAQPAGVASADLRAGRATLARTRIEGELTRSPDDLAALDDLAVSYAIDGRTGAARTLLEEVVAHGGPSEGLAALVNLAALYAGEGYQEAAAAHLASARAVDPARPEPLYALALLADARGELPAAQGALRSALAADPGGAVAGELAFLRPEGRQHLEALVAEEEGDAALAAARFRELAQGRFPLLLQAAQRHLAALADRPSVAVAGGG